MDNSSIFHNPGLRDKNAKRTREEGSCSNTNLTHDKFEIMYMKKPELNLVNEKEEIDKTLQIIDTHTVVRESTTPIVSEETHQPSTSNTQSIRRNLVLKSLHPTN